MNGNQLTNKQHKTPAIYTQHRIFVVFNLILNKITQGNDIQDKVNNNLYIYTVMKSFQLLEGYDLIVYTFLKKDQISVRS